MLGAGGGGGRVGYTVVKIPHSSGINHLSGGAVGRVEAHQERTLGAD